jgi:hypothetical protein
MIAQFCSLLQEGGTKTKFALVSFVPFQIRRERKTQTQKATLFSCHCFFLWVGAGRI